MIFMAEGKEGAPGVLVPKDLQRGLFYAPYGRP